MSEQDFSSWEGIFKSPFNGRVQVMPSLDEDISKKVLPDNLIPVDGDCSVEPFLEIPVLRQEVDLETKELDVRYD